MNQSALRAAEERVTSAGKKLSDLGVNRAVLESTTLLLEKEFMESIEMMAEYAHLTDVNFDPVLYSPGGTIGNKIRTACGVMAIMRERLGIIYEAFIDLTQIANESKAAIDGLTQHATRLETFSKDIEVKPGEGNITPRDPQNVAGLVIKGQKVRFHNLTPIDNTPRVRAELLPISEQPLSPRSELRGMDTRVRPTGGHWPEFVRPVAAAGPSVPAARQVTRPERRGDDTDDDEGETSCVSDLETVKTSVSPSPTRRARLPTIDRPGNPRVLVRPETVRAIPSSRPASGWRDSLPGASDIDWKTFRKQIRTVDLPVTKHLKDSELYDIIIGRKRVRRSPDLGEHLRSLL